MNSLSSKFVFSSAAFGLAMTAAFTACGDKNTTEVNESTSLDIVAKGDSLPECGADNVGDMIFVTDSSAVYYCSGEKWSMLNGKDGKKGAEGEQGEKGATGDRGEDGDDGANCTAKTVENGIEVTCGDKVIGTIKNGEPGKATEGEKGNSCSATQDEKTKNVIITCETDDGKGVTYTIQNGTDGKSAYEVAKESDENIGDVAAWLASFKGKAGENCTIANYEDAEKDESGYKITCGSVEKVILNGADGEDGASCSVKDKGNGNIDVTCGKDNTVTLYKALCGGKGFEPTKSFCRAGALYSCGDKPYDPEKDYCLTLNGQDDEPIYKIEAWLLDDRDNHRYKTVKIGDQTWMAQNLNYAYKKAKFDIEVGESTYIDDSTSWCGGGNHSVGNCNTYGRLYTWAAAIDSVALYETDNSLECGYTKTCDRLSVESLKDNPIQGVCPKGWHLPSKAEWETLFNAVDANYAAGTNVVGIKLKSASDDWKVNEGQSGGTDVYGFSALPAGEHLSNNYLEDLGIKAYFWSSSEVSVDNANHIEFSYDKTQVNNGDSPKSYGYSVRCVMD